MKWSQSEGGCHPIGIIILISKNVKNVCNFLSVTLGTMLCMKVRFDWTHFYLKMMWPDFENGIRISIQSNREKNMFEHRKLEYFHFYKCPFLFVSSAFF